MAPISDCCEKQGSKDSPSKKVSMIFFIRIFNRRYLTLIDNHLLFLYELRCESLDTYSPLSLRYIFSA